LLLGITYAFALVRRGKLEKMLQHDKKMLGLAIVSAPMTMREITLTNRDGSPAGVLTWNAETGELPGDHADEIVEMSRHATRESSVTTHPYPTVAITAHVRA